MISSFSRSICTSGSTIYFSIFCMSYSFAFLLVLYSIYISIWICQCRKYTRKKQKKHIPEILIISMKKRFFRRNIIFKKKYMHGYIYSSIFDFEKAHCINSRKIKGSTCVSFLFFSIMKYLKLKFGFLTTQGNHQELTKKDNNTMS